jgi:hypothetical protein
MSAPGARSGKLLRIRGRHTDVVTTNGDTGAVSLVDDVVGDLEVVRVRDHLVSGDNILGVESARSSRIQVELSREGAAIRARAGEGSGAQVAAAPSDRGESYLVDKHIGGVCVV